MVWFVLIAGLAFIAYNIFFNSGGAAKFKSDLPKEKGDILKKKKGVLICFLILFVISLVLLIAALISFL